MSETRVDLKDIKNDIELYVESRDKFLRLMMEYQCAILEIRTKFEVLNTELSLDSESNPIESMTTRLKKPSSIIEKLKRRNLPLTVDSIRENLHDVAGVRVICSFVKDIYLLADKICSQDDIRVIERKDYIKKPKDNGYRSLHLILEVPVFFITGKKWMKVEVQLRTIAMDFWASIEHKIKYKKEIDDIEFISTKLKKCADNINSLDDEMEIISEIIKRK